MPKSYLKTQNNLHESSSSEKAVTKVCLGRIIGDFNFVFFLFQLFYIEHVAIVKKKMLLRKNATLEERRL